jgi:ABC-type proline/glycine betaine transport system ATPase subunit
LSVIKKLAKDSKGKVLIDGIEIKETKIAKVRV